MGRPSNTAYFAYDSDESEISQANYLNYYR